jgi:hypothetical protein
MLRLRKRGGIFVGEGRLFFRLVIGMLDPCCNSNGNPPQIVRDHPDGREQLIAEANRWGAMLLKACAL